MKPSKIGVFDSGVGGLFVLKELLNIHPFNEYYYYGDTLHMPYGNKDIQELLQYSHQIIDYFQKQKVDLIICACGTLSSNILKEMQEYSQIPVIGILNDTINYLNDHNFNNILVLSTMNTHKSGYFKKHIHKNVTSLGADNLAYLIENNLAFDDYLDNLLRDYHENYDAIVLGCTHYSTIKNYLQKNYTSAIIDMGIILANSLTFANHQRKLHFYFSQNDAQIKKKIQNILEIDEEEICLN